MTGERSEQSLARRTANIQTWTLPAYARYQEQADPVNNADIVIKVDDPRHPALLGRDGQ